MEPRRIDQHDWTIVHCEFVGSLGFPRTRLEVGADVKLRLACKIDELNWLRLGG